MMRHGPEFEAERKARSQYVLDVTRVYIDRPRMRRLLGARATRLLEVLDVLEVPDIVDGSILDLLDYKDREVVPFSLVRVGERLTRTVQVQTPLQRAEIERVAERFDIDPGDADDDEEPQVYSEETYLFRSSLAETLGRSWFRLEQGDDTVNFYLSFRPMITMRLHHGHVAHAVTHLVHEASHAADMLDTPLQIATPEDGSLETELRAFSADSVVTRDIFGQNIQDTATRVEQIRRRHNGSRFRDEAFLPNDAIKHDLVTEGLDAIYKSGHR